MALPAATFDNIVSISDFSRGGASKAFEKAQGSVPVIVMKNNRPTAVITSPAEYAYLSETEEDFVLLSESVLRLARNGWQDAVSFGDALDELGITQEDLASCEDVELG